MVSATPNPRRANGHRRDQVRRRVLAEETCCHICGQVVDKSLGKMPGVHSPRCRNNECSGCVYHPKSPVVDELVPVALGGSPFDRSNCSLACRDCNSRRGKKSLEEMRALSYKQVGQPLRTSRAW